MGHSRNPALSNFEVEPRSQNLEEANRILDEALSRRRTEPKAQPSWSLSPALDKELAEAQQLFVSIKAQLKKVGIELPPNIMNLLLLGEQVFKKRKLI